MSQNEWLFFFLVTGALVGCLAGLIRRIGVAVLAIGVGCFAVSIFVGIYGAMHAESPKDAAEIRMWFPITIPYGAIVCAVPALGVMFVVRKGRGK
jgi:hypothetical protein